jgi:N-formylglutamate amidohydrolase
LAASELGGLPAGFTRLVRLESAEVRKTLGFGCDAAAPVLSGYEKLCEQLSLSGVRNGLARAYVDCNREITDVSGLALDGADEARHQHGVIWARTVLTSVPSETLHDAARLNELVNKNCEPLLRRPLSQKEFGNLMTAGYDPYHREISAHHRRITGLHGTCVHVALHTLPAFVVAVAQGGYACGKPAARGPLDLSGNALPDVILIHNDFAAADRRYVDAIRRAFIESGLIVSDGTGPFVGANGVTKMYGNPRNGVHVIGIEHVTHDGIEPGRHLGSTAVDKVKARTFQSAYRQAMMNLLRLN